MHKTFKTLTSQMMQTMKTQDTLSTQKVQKNISPQPEPPNTNKPSKPGQQPTDGYQQQQQQQNTSQPQQQNVNQQQTTASYYYDNIKQSMDLLKDKTVAVKFANADLFNIVEIKTANDFYDIINNNISSIYEPISNKINSFRLYFDNKYNKKQIFAMSRILCKKLNNIGFESILAKNGNSYFIKCASKKEHNTNKIFSYASDITNGINVDLSELKYGKMKKYYYSLSDTGTQDVIIEF